MITETQNLVDTSALSHFTLLGGRSGIVLVSPCDVPCNRHGSECNEDHRCVCRCACQYRIHKHMSIDLRDLQFIEEPVTGITVGMQNSGMASKDQAENTQSAQGASGRA